MWSLINVSIRTDQKCKKICHICQKENENETSVVNKNVCLTNPIRTTVNRIVMKIS